MKKLISMALVVAMLATMATIPAFAAEADYNNSGILGYIDFENNYDLSKITTSTNAEIVTDKDDPSNHVLKITAPKKGEGTLSLLFGDITKNLTKDSVYNVSFKAYTVAPEGTEPSRFTFYTQNTKLNSTKNTGLQEVNKVVEMKVVPQTASKNTLTALDGGGTALILPNTKGIGNYTTELFSDGKTNELTETEYKLTDVSIKLDFMNNKVSLRTYDWFKVYSGTENTSNLSWGRDLQYKSNGVSYIELNADAEYLDVLRFGIEAVSTNTTETAYNTQAELYIDDIRIEKEFTPNSVEGFELKKASAKNWKAALGTGGTVSYINKNAELTIPAGTAQNQAFALQNYVGASIDATKNYEFGYDVTIPQSTAELAIRGLMNGKDNDGADNGKAKEYGLINYTTTRSPEADTTYKVRFIIDAANEKIHIYIDDKFIEDKPFHETYDLDSVLMVQGGVITKAKTTKEYKVKIDNIYFRELDAMQIVDSAISTSSETAFNVNDGIVITFSNAVKNIKATSPNNSADNNVKLYKGGNEVAATITYPNAYSIRIDEVGGFEKGETYTVILAKELYGKGFTYAPLGKEMTLNYTSSDDDVLEMSIEAVTGGYNINITNAGSEVTGATLIIASYDSVTNRLEDVEIIGENVTIPTTGYVSDTPIELTVPQGGCVKAFLLNNLETITPLCDSAEL